MIRYLKQDEKLASRPLWEEVFTEDSSSFLDFYYTEKIRHNRILADEEGGGMAAMLHRNPYDLVVNDRIWKSDYIVGVATREDWRRRGLMAGLMKRCLNDMYAEQMEFCFLYPVNPALYEPFGFAYIYDYQPVGFRETTDALTIRACVGASGDYEAAAGFTEKVLGGRYDVHCLRTEGYYASLAREVRSDNGDLMFLQNRNKELSAVSAFYGDGNSDVREFICLPETERKVGKAKPRMMARITCLERFVKVIRLRKDCGINTLSLTIHVTDPVIRQNDGLFCWTLDENGSTLDRMETGADNEPDLVLDIARLTAWMFGYRQPDLAGQVQGRAEVIRVLQGVYLPEII